MNGGVAVGVGTDVGAGVAVCVAVSCAAGWVTVLAGSSDWDVSSHAANRTASTSDAAATANTHLSFIVRPMGLSMRGCVGMARGGGWGGGWDDGGGGTRLVGAMEAGIPAFAGMTGVGAGMAGGGRRVAGGGARGGGWGGLGVV